MSANNTGPASIGPAPMCAQFETLNLRSKWSKK